ncbi:MAG: 30S ribosome-binding factor RbfA [Candidatus Zixiibacteriota bacterium]
MSRRTKRVSKLLQETISEIILNDVSDPRLEFITITGVDVSPDLKHANVFYSILGDETERDDVKEAFESAGGYIQRLVTETIHLQYAPQVIFKYDNTLAKAQKMEELIEKTQSESENDSGEID